MTELPIRFFKSTKDWAAWLQKNHLKSPGLWLRMAKKDTGLASANYGEALDWALRYGWIDSQKKSYDEKTWLQRFTPRGPNSIWSQVNRAKVLKFHKAGLMKPLGLKAMETAKKNGRWKSAYAGQGTIKVPPDLGMALKKNPAAGAFFKTLRGSERYAVLFRLHHVKKAEARAKKIAAYVALMGQKKKIAPFFD